MHDLATIAQLGRGLPMWLGLMTLWTGGLLALAWLADRALRRVAEPGLRIAFFAVVLVRVALPVDWQTPVGVLDDGATRAVATGPSAAQMPVTAEPFVVVAETRAPAVAYAQTSAPIDAFGLAAIAVYLVGAIALLAVVLRRLRRIGSVLAHSTPMMVQRGVPIHVHAHAGPMVIGLRRPTIVVPEAMLVSTAAGVLDAVLRHEHAHVRHRDGVSALAMALLCALAWPLVPVWIAVARIRLLMELRADAAVVQACDAPVVRSYRRLLLDMAQRRWPAHVLAPGLDPVAALRARLGAMANRPRVPWLLQLVFVGPLAVTLLIVAARRSGDVSSTDRVVEPIASPLASAGDVLATPSDIFVPPYPHCREHEGKIRLPAGSQQISGVPRAEARYVSGLGHAANGRMVEAASHISEAAWEAANLEYDLLASESAAAMVLVLHRGGPQAEAEAMAWSRHAVAAIDRAGMAGPMAIEMHRALATMAERRGESDLAATHHAEAEAIDATCEVVSGSPVRAPRGG